MKKEAHETQIRRVAIRNSPDNLGHINRVQPAHLRPERLRKIVFRSWVICRPVDRIGEPASSEQEHKLGRRCHGRIPGTRPGITAHCVARCFYGQRRDITEILRVSVSLPSGGFRRKPSVRSEFCDEFTEPWCLLFAQTGKQNVLRIEEHEHRGPPVGVRTDPFPFLVKVVRRVGVEVQTRIVVLTRSDRPNQNLQGFNGLRYARRLLAAVHLGIDRQTIA